MKRPGNVPLVALAAAVVSLASFLIYRESHSPEPTPPIIPTLHTAAGPSENSGHRSPVLPIWAASGRVVVLRHDSLALEYAPRLQLDSTPILTIPGSDDPAFDISDATTFAVTSGGTVLTFAPHSSRLLTFTPGENPRQIGRRGSGPGEFRGVEVIARGLADTILIPDFALMRMNRVTARAGVVKEEPLVDRLPRSFGRVVGQLSNGEVVMSSAGTVQRGQPGGVSRPPAWVGVLAPVKDLSVVAEVPDLETVVMETRYEGRRGTESWPVRFGLRARLAVWDSIIVTAPGNTYRLELRDAAGKITSIIEVDAPRRAVDAASRHADIQARLDRLALATASGERPRDPDESRRLIRETPFADSLPSYSALHVTPDGILWVVDAILPADTSWSATAFRHDGAIVGRLRAATTAFPVAFGDDRVVVSRTDADGLRTLAVYRVVPVS